MLPVASKVGIALVQLKFTSSFFSTLIILDLILHIRSNGASLDVKIC